MKNSWKEAVLAAQHLEAVDPRERLKRCDLARLEDRGGKALIKKYENDQRQEDHQQRSRPGDSEAAVPLRSPSTSPAVSPKKNSSPGAMEPHKKSSGGGSGHYNRRDEMEYKMHRLSEGGQARKRKISHSEDKGAAVRPKPVIPPVMFETPRATPTFSRSFKIKKDKPAPGGEGEAASLAKNVSGQKDSPLASGTISQPANGSLPEKVEEGKRTKVSRSLERERNNPDSTRKEQKVAGSVGDKEESHKKDAKAADTVKAAEKKKSTPVGKETATVAASPEDLVSFEPGEGALGRLQWQFPAFTISPSIFLTSLEQVSVFRS